MCLELCYKALANVLTKMNHTKDVHQRLLDKQDRIESIAANLTSQMEGSNEQEIREQLQEVQEMVRI